MLKQDNLNQSSRLGSKMEGQTQEEFTLDAKFK